MKKKTAGASGDRCVGRVRRPGAAFNQTDQCSRRASLDGYCRVHHPDHKQARRLARLSKWQQQFNERTSMAAYEKKLTAVGAAVIGELGLAGRFHLVSELAVADILRRWEELCRSRS